MSAYAIPSEIDAFVSKGGEGDKITIMMMPDKKAWRFADISVETARILAQRLNAAAAAAEKNTPKN